MCAYTAKRESLFVFGAVLITGFVCAVQVEAQRHRAPVKGSMPASDTFAYEKPENKDRFSFNLDNVDLLELVKIIGNITGKRFILGGKRSRMKATVFAPRKVNAEQAYQAFLSVLRLNGLTVVPTGTFYKIVPVKAPASRNTPIVLGKRRYPSGQVRHSDHHTGSREVG